MHVDSSAYPSHMQQERAAKDLKTKGRATITPKLLISTIIDHNINQYAADKARLVCLGSFDQKVILFFRRLNKKNLKCYHSRMRWNARYQKDT